MDMRYGLALVLAAVVPCVAAPVTLPPYGRERPLPVPKITKKTLRNGLQIWVVPRVGLPRVDYVLAVRNAGLAADDPAHPGLASTLAGLLNEGAGTRDSRAIAEAAQAMGGTVAAAAEFDGVVVSANALPSAARAMMELLADVARRPTFDEREVALAKANEQQALKAAEATPRFRAERAVAAAIYGSHPYGHTQATQASIDAVTVDLLKTTHAVRFRPDRSLLVITGRLKPTEAIQLATSAFSDWKNEKEAPPDAPAVPASAAPIRVLLERPGSVQATLRLGRPGQAAGGKDQVPLRLTSTLLGGSFSSRVNLNLREAKGYTYGATAGARSFRNGGAIVAGTDVRNAVAGAALTEYFNEYERIGRELVSADELQMNKRYMAGSYLLANQLQASVARTLAGNWLVGLPAEFLGRYVPEVQKVTAEQVRDMGRKYFAPTSQSIIVVGDPGAISEQLKPFGDFTSSGGR